MSGSAAGPGGNQNVTVHGRNCGSLVQIKFFSQLTLCPSTNELCL